MELHYRQTLPKEDCFYLDSFFKKYFNDTLPLNLTRLHGFLCAIISSPTIVKPAEWTSILLGNTPDFDSIMQAERVMDLILELYQQISAQLRGVEPFELLLWDGNKYQDLQDCSEWLLEDWCYGYLEGIKLDPLWETDSHALSMLTPFRLFSERKKTKQLVALGESPEVNPNNTECMQQYRKYLADFVQDNYAYWLNERKEEIRLHHDKKKNETRCPCGSKQTFDDCLCGERTATH